MMHPLNIRPPDVRNDKTQIWLFDVCIGVRCENVATFNVRGGHITLSGAVMVGETYEQFPGPNGERVTGGKLFVRRVVNEDTLETRNLTTGMPGQCSIQFLLNPNNFRKVK